MKKVILLSKIHGLGNLGDEVKVKPGFARNFLLPQRKAVSATSANIEIFEKRRAEYESKETELLSAAQVRAEKIAALATLTISSKAADEGKLYGSIGIFDIVNAMVKAGVEVSKSEVRLPAGPIRQIGEYPIDFYLHGDVVSRINLVIVAE